MDGKLPGEYGGPDASDEVAQPVVGSPDFEYIGILDWFFVEYAESRIPKVMKFSQNFVFSL